MLVKFQNSPIEPYIVLGPLSGRIVLFIHYNWKFLDYQSLKNFFGEIPPDPVLELQFLDLAVVGESFQTV